MEPANSSGDGDLDRHNELPAEWAAAPWLCRKAMRLGGFEEFVQVDIVIGAIVEDDQRVDDGEAGEEAACWAASTMPFSTQECSSWEWRRRRFRWRTRSCRRASALHLDFAIAELTATAALALLGPARRSAAANGLAIRNLGRLEDYPRCGTRLLSLETMTSMCCWPVPAMRILAVCGSRKKRNIASTLPSACECRCSACPQSAQVLSSIWRR